MSFFESEIVQSELTEIEQLQEKIFSCVFTFSSMSKRDKIEHVDLLEKLLEKQEILYARLSLSDDPRAKEMKEKIKNSAKDFGFAPDTDLGYVFSNMAGIVKNLKQAIDES